MHITFRFLSSLPYDRNLIKHVLFDDISIFGDKFYDLRQVLKTSVFRGTLI